METIKLQINSENAHDKYKYIFANDSEEVKNYRKHKKDSNDFLEVNQPLGTAFDKAARKAIDEAIKQAIKGVTTGQK